MKFKYLELALATIVLLFACYDLLGQADYAWRGLFNPADHDSRGFAQHGLRYSFTLNYLIPRLALNLTYYGAFLWVATSLPNKYAEAKKWRQALLTWLAGWLVAWLIASLTEFCANPFYSSSLVHGFYRQLGSISLFFFVLAVYLAVKHTVAWLLTQKINLAEQSAKSTRLFDIAALTVAWLVLTGVAVALQARAHILFFMLLVVSCFFLTCLVNLHWLIPVYFKHPRKKQFWLLQLGVTFLLNLPLTGTYAVMASYSPFALITIFIVFWFSQLCLAIPLAYFVHRWRADNAAQINTLKTNLNASATTLQFLRGQINPHFLFNALNSLYSMALTEQADKTGEGIQRLGDMMRFMLHENNQEQIALSSEIEYLQNYIAMQNIRIAASPDIQITVDIAEADTTYQIAPMLLVPFIENAYKHGISLKEPSWININLSVLNGALQFDVRNSIHPERQNDPERRSSGIGLENVKQRLALLYPERHSLVIRKTAAEYFIYLNLQLK